MKKQGARDVRPPQEQRSILYCLISMTLVVVISDDIQQNQCALFMTNALDSQMSYCYLAFNLKLFVLLFSYSTV